MTTTKWLAGGMGIVALTGVALAQAVPRPAAPPPAATAPAPAGRNAFLPATQTLFDGYVRTGKMPGIVGAFGVGDLPTQFVSAGRIADDAGAATADADSLWRVYSMTKPITAMAAMILIEEGKLGLDDRLDKYFPAFAKMRVLTSPDTSLASVPAKNPITIRNLLTHTAGLSYNIIAKGPLLKEYERLGLLPGAINAEVEAKARLVRPATLQAFANRLAQAPLIAEPGTKWSYSVGLDLMGAVIEKVSGMPFDAFVQARLLTPLGMTSTYWTVPASAAGRLSSNYTFVGDKRVLTDPGATSLWLSPPQFPYGGAGIVSSARDYDRFLHMLANAGTLDGVQVMKPATARLAMSNLLPAGVFFGGIGSDTGGTAAGPKMGFGAGGSVYLEDKPGGPSKGTYGWGGAAGTIAFVDPVKRVRVTVMVQYFPAGQWPLRADIPTALAADLARFK